MSPISRLGDVALQSNTENGTRCFQRLNMEILRLRPPPRTESVSISRLAGEALERLWRHMI